MFIQQNQTCGKLSPPSPKQTNKKSLQSKDCYACCYKVRLHQHLNTFKLLPKKEGGQARRSIWDVYTKGKNTRLRAILIQPFLPLPLNATLALFLVCTSMFQSFVLCYMLWLADPLYSTR